jgi:hypothetical protein
MKQWMRFLVVFIMALSGLVQAGVVGAAKEQPTAEASSAAVLETESEPAADATASPVLVTPIVKGPDLTEVTGAHQGLLDKFVLQNLTGPIKPYNFLRWAIRAGVAQGMSANTLVLILMFPLVTALIAASRHLLGLQGFGIFTPAIVAVGFLATGLVTGILLFLIIIAAATLGRMAISKLRLAYMPRTSLLLWLVSLTVLVTLLISPYLNFQELSRLSIFPILMMVLLAETFMEVQNKRSFGQAVEMTLETLLMAAICYFVMNLEMVQKFILLNPELMLLLIAVFNVFLGKYSGLRLFEYWRFRKMIE